MLPVESILKEKSIPYRLIELLDRAYTVQDVVKYSKGDILVNEICKTIIAKSDNGYSYAFFLYGNDRVDFEKTSLIIGEKIHIAKPSEVKELAGVEPGAVCPVLLSIPVIMDTKIVDFKNVNFGSGHHLFGLELSTKDFIKLINPKIADISKC